MAEKIALRLFLYGRGPGTGHVAEKIAYGYFLLLRNKKQLILMVAFLAAAAATETHGRKIAYGYFLLLRNKKCFISMAVARGRATWPKK